jgi:hypothetical protein
VVFGPILALLLVASLKVEADTLLVARLAILDEASELKLRAKVSWLVYLLFAVPTAAAAFIAIQFFLQLVPRPEGCEAWSWARHLFDLRYWEGTPSTYCLGNITGAPWIYPPLQAYLYLACVSACGYLTYRLAKDWRKARGGTG